MVSWVQTALLEASEYPTRPLHRWQKPHLARLEDGLGRAAIAFRPRVSIGPLAVSTAASSSSMKWVCMTLLLQPKKTYAPLQQQEQEAWSAVRVPATELLRLGSEGSFRSRSRTERVTGIIILLVAFARV